MGKQGFEKNNKYDYKYINLKKYLNFFNTLLTVLG